jgi:hypothetical protein
MKRDIPTDYRTTRSSTRRTYHLGALLVSAAAYVFAHPRQRNPNHLYVNRRLSHVRRPGHRNIHGHVHL